MRKMMVIGAGLTALALAACDAEVSARSTRSDGEGYRISGDTVQTGKHELTVASRLDCPEREGSLRLAQAASDGRSCFYRSRDGDAEVELRLASLNGPIDAQLLALESNLRGLVPAAAAAADAPPLPPAPPPTDDTGVKLGVGVNDNEAEVRLPGLRIDARDDRATIRLPGVSIDADDGRADIRVRDDGESVTVRADDRGAEIRSVERVSGADGDVRSTYLLASETAGPAGWRVAGYKAQGPGAGPLVIGVLRAKGRRDGDLMDEVEELIERNVDKR